MKKIFPIFALALGVGLFTVFWTGSFSTVYALQSNEESLEAALDGIDAVQAMALANEWRWSPMKIISVVTTREIIFTFPSKKVKYNLNKGNERRIPLPDDKMVVAVAPYIKQTHK